MNFPSKCPYCGKDNAPNEIQNITELNHIDDVSIYHTGLTLELHACIHCQKPIFVIKQETITSRNSLVDSKIIFYYPTATSVDFPARTKKLSPNAYKTYEQTIKANESGLDMLIGAGLRISLEWLAWDYLIKVKDFTQTEIEKLSLYQRLEKMKGNFYTDVCTKLIRLFGNDSVHIIKQLDFSTEEVIQAFKMLCQLIDSELQIIEVNKRLVGKS